MKFQLKTSFIAASLILSGTATAAARHTNAKDSVTGLMEQVILSMAADSLCVDCSVQMPWSNESRPFAVYGAAARVNLSTSGDFAPYYVMSNRNGLTTQADGVQARAFIYRPLYRENRFSYGFGADVVGGWTKGTEYARYSPDSGWGYRNLHQPAFWIQDLYGEVKYRGVFLTAGLKENNRSIFDNDLNSGDIVMSNNARPVPQIRVGFIDFQNIPLTQGWVQIQGEVAYGKFIDSDWLRDHYNRYNSFVTTGAFMQYSRLYLRSNPDKPFSVTVGMQHATQFGGKWQIWEKGEVVATHKEKLKFKDWFNAFLPTGGDSDSDIQGESFMKGNHLGSWDIKARYRFTDGSELTAYAQLPWEDGSGIGKLNGFDGVWGLHYRLPHYTLWLRNIVAEYIDFTNQSGPMHWAPGDFPGTNIPGEATGADDYYNNFMYNGWANYGMAMGSPFVKSPIYNTDGYMRFTDNRVRGFHIGADGSINANLDWRVLFSYRTSWGTPMIPQLRKLHDTSMLAECRWQMPGNPHLSLLGALAFDAGKLYGNNFGGYVTLRYIGLIL